MNEFQRGSVEQPPPSVESLDSMEIAPDSMPPSGDIEPSSAPVAPQETPSPDLSAAGNIPVSQAMEEEPTPSEDLSSSSAPASAFSDPPLPPDVNPACPLERNTPIVSKVLVTIRTDQSIYNASASTEDHALLEFLRGFISDPSSDHPYLIFEDTGFAQNLENGIFTFYSYAPAQGPLLDRWTTTFQRFHISCNLVNANLASQTTLRLFSFHRMMISTDNYTTTFLDFFKPFGTVLSIIPAPAKGKKVSQFTANRKPALTFNSVQVLVAMPPGGMVPISPPPSDLTFFFASHILSAEHKCHYCNSDTHSRAYCPSAPLCRFCTISTHDPRTCSNNDDPSYRVRKNAATNNRPRKVPSQNSGTPSQTIPSKNPPSSSSITNPPPVVSTESPPATPPSSEEEGTEVAFTIVGDNNNKRQKQSTKSRSPSPTTRMRTASPPPTPSQPTESGTGSYYAPLANMDDTLEPPNTPAPPSLEAPSITLDSPMRTASSDKSHRDPLSRKERAKADLSLHSRSPASLHKSHSSRGRTIERFLGIGPLSSSLSKESARANSVATVSDSLSDSSFMTAEESVTQQPPVANREDTQVDDSSVYESAYSQ